MGAIEKAKTILVEGVTAFVQVSTKTRRWNPDDEDESDAVAARRQKVVNILKNLSKTHHSFAFAQMASMASSDPFVKIRGLIEDMIAKLVKEAEEEATQKAFCDAEMGKSKKSQDEKTMTLDKLQARIDGAASTVSENTESIKTLEAEVAEIDKAQAEATALRTKEHEEYQVASKDFRDSAEAEATEDEAAKAYKALSDENKVSKATKQAEGKGKASEVKSLTVQLEHSKEDHASVSSELDAVNAYIDKLRPQCEEKAMSYEEKKARREAEIAGLKEALEILAGDGLALVQTKTSFRQIKRV